MSTLNQIKVENTIYDIEDTQARRDLLNKVDKNEIPSINGLATEEYVDNAIANIDIPSGGESGYILEKTIIIEEDVNIVNVNFETSFNSLLIIYNGRVNNAEDTLSNANASVSIKNTRNGSIFFNGDWAYVRGAGTSLISTCTIDQLIQRLIRTETCRAVRNPVGAAVAYSNVGEIEINSLCIFLSNAEHLFKVGGIFEIYRK